MNEQVPSKVVMILTPATEVGSSPAAVLRYIRPDGSTERLDRQVAPTSRQLAGMRRHGMTRARDLGCPFVDYTPQTSKRKPSDGDIHPTPPAHPAVR
jgi:hypothetical protein